MTDDRYDSNMYDWRVEPRLPPGWDFHPGHSGEMSNSSPAAESHIVVPTDRASLFALSSATCARLGSPPVEVWSVHHVLVPRSFECMWLAEITCDGSRLQLGVLANERRGLRVYPWSGTSVRTLEKVAAALDAASAELLRDPIAPRPAAPLVRSTGQDPADAAAVASFGWPPLPDGWSYGDSVQGEVPADASAQRSWPEDVLDLLARFDRAEATSLGCKLTLHSSDSSTATLEVRSRVRVLGAPPKFHAIVTLGRSPRHSSATLSLVTYSPAPDARLDDAAAYVDRALT